MKNVNVVVRRVGAAILLSACTGIAHAAGEPHGHSHQTKPLHGGVLVLAKDVEYELVVAPTLVQLYLSDHGKPIDISKATAKLTLLAASEKQEVTLTPAGDKLEAAGSFKVGAGVKAVVAVSGAGKASAARFTLK
ncbi:hypothetical protein BH09PSE5_BH09PSE5_44660 [soil metagenome]